jgi:hypothetical protein
MLNWQTFAFCNQIATVCEQSATVSVVGWRLQQFATNCNIQRSEDGSQATQNPVVEHQGSSDGVVVFVCTSPIPRNLLCQPIPQMCPPLV